MKKIVCISAIIFAISMSFVSSAFEIKSKANGNIDYLEKVRLLEEDFKYLESEITKLQTE